MEEVFDRRTIMTVLKMLNTGKLKQIHGVAKSGKESRVYHGTDSSGEDVAVKIFLTTSAIFKQGRLKYLHGDPRFREIPHDTSSLVDQWAIKEFWNLRLARDAGINVPEPLHVENNVLVMKFIGKDGVPAPLLKDVQLQTPNDWYRTIAEMVKKLYTESHLIHGDISEYNIMVPDGYPVLFDFGQAVPTEHPEAQTFLKRDISNLNRYFRSLNVRTLSYRTIIGEKE